MAFPRPVIITANKGSDIDADIQFQETDGTPFELFGWTVGSYSASPDLTSPTDLVTVTVTDQIEGKVHLRVEWDERLQVGVGYIVRILLQDTPEDQATPEIGILYQ